MKPSKDTPDELLGVAETLESHRPQLSALDADRVKQRAMAQGARPATATSTKGTFMRSRLALIAMLACGLLMTGSGAALGVSALSDSPSASVAQYGPSDDEEVLGKGPGGQERPPAAVAQPSRQVEAGGGGKIPFTGYAAIPTLLIGIALLAMGLILRGRSDSSTAQA